MNVDRLQVSMSPSLMSTFYREGGFAKTDESGSRNS